MYKVNNFKELMHFANLFWEVDLRIHNGIYLGDSFGAWELNGHKIDASAMNSYFEDGKFLIF